jgi:hypothetical protein
MVNQVGRGSSCLEAATTIRRRLLVLLFKAQLLAAISSDLVAA